MLNDVIDDSIPAGIEGQNKLCLLLGRELLKMINEVISKPNEQGECCFRRMISRGHLVDVMLGRQIIEGKRCGKMEGKISRSGNLPPAAPIFCQIPYLNLDAARKAIPDSLDSLRLVKDCFDLTEPKESV